MHMIWTNRADELAGKGAAIVADLLRQKPDAAIAVPTGATPLGLYRHLVERHRAGTLTCDRARFFNLDEFAGKGPDDSGSYGSVLWRHLFSPLGLRSEQVRLLQGDSADPDAECADFERAVTAAGGLDLCILGLGVNGHVAFNEPGSDWNAPTRPVELAAETKRAQSMLYASAEDVPHRGLTMGVATIRAARSVLLLVSGNGKRKAFAALEHGKPDRAWPVTALLDHPNLTVLVDAEAVGGDADQHMAYGGHALVP
ncbi:glucosamine-6-phosphate deaminase [Labrys neptuniae]